MLSQQEVLENIKDTVQRWVEGKVDKKAFDEFLTKADRDLDKIKVEKEKSAEFWRDYNARCYY